MDTLILDLDLECRLCMMVDPISDALMVLVVAKSGNTNDSFRSKSVGIE